MKIAIDARAAAETAAGRGRYVRELIAGFARMDADHEFTLLARERWGEAALDRRFTWRTFSAPGLLWPLLAGVRMSASADVGLACTSYAITAPWRIPGAAIVWDFAPFERSLRSPRGSLLERWTLPLAVRRCEILVAISEATRGELEQRFPSAAGKAIVAHPGVDTSFSPDVADDDRAILERLGVSKPYVLATGTLEPRKNLPRLIEAFAGLEPGLRAGWTLVLAGAPGWETEATLASIAAHPQLVRSLGYVSEARLPCLYRHAEVFCYVSLYEGFGIPVLEAMRSGTAVLTSSVSSMPEVGGEAACYADPRDVASIRAGMRRLILDEELRRRYAAAGQTRAALFDWDKTARAVLASLERLARDRA